MPNPYGYNGTDVPPPPDEIMRPLIEKWAAEGYTNPQILTNLKDFYDSSSHRLSLSLLKKKRMQWGIKSARGQAHTVETIGPAIERIRERFPMQGSRDMKETLRMEEGILVDRHLVLAYMNLHHRDEVIARTHRRLKRRQFWSAGVNDFWYCDTVQGLGVMPLQTQSDPGTENNGIANGHTLLRHLHDPTLARTLQHMFKGSHRNIKPEIFWSQLRRRWSHGFETILDIGVNAGWYNADDTLQRHTFHYLFIPWTQQQLDLFRTRINDTRPRFNIHKVLPHGRPKDIFRSPTRFKSCDFGVRVNPDLLSEVRATYAPSDHEVFKLVPDPFAAYANDCMQQMGNPHIHHGNVWQVYRGLLGRLRAVIQHVGQVVVSNQDAIGAEVIPVMDLPPYVIEDISSDEEDRLVVEFTSSESEGGAE